MPARILVVDDDETIRYSLRVLLEGEHYELYTAVNGDEALRILKSVSIQAVIADIWMPGMTGLELLSRIHELDESLPVILLTGSASLDTSIEAVNQGACAYLLKPLLAHDVRSAVTRCLLKATQMRQRQFNEQQLLERYHALESYLLYLQGNQQGMNPETITVISDLLRGLRHELGNLATVINLDVSLLEESSTGTALDQARLDELKDNVSDLGRLLARLKEYPQPNAHLEPVDLRRLVEDTVEYMKKRVDNARMTINCRLPLQAVWVNGDEAGLGRVLANVLDNALDANRESRGQVVDLALDVSAEDAVIAIADQGPGFHGKMLDAPFSPAYTTKITDGFLRGLGMGLFVSNAIISLHGGMIALQNQPTGGALVTIRLPRLLE